MLDSLVWSIFFALLIYYTPSIIQNYGNLPVYYYLVMGLVFAVNRYLINTYPYKYYISFSNFILFQILAQIMVTCMVAFFSRISDIRFGGMYMTLLNTVRSIGWVIPNTSFLKMVDVLTFSSCSNDVQNSCSTPDLENICSLNDGNCETIVDGYYVEVVMCLVIGFIWYAVYKRHLKFFESKDRSHWECLNITNDSTWKKPNLKGDWCNIFLLVLLYTIQGIPLGLSAGLPIILQSKYMVTYNDQGSYSFVMWPYTIKLLWAPIVDSFYIRRIGRRKSWFIPVQYLIGALLLYFASNTDEWLPESGKPNLRIIVYLLFIINLLNTTQDIIVDSWALTMLKKNNVSYASTCNFVGVFLGMLIGSSSPVLLSSEQFCNKYLRITPGPRGIITIKITIFKKEKDINLEDHFSISVFLVTLLTSTTIRIGNCVMDSIAYLKLIEAGVSKEDIMLLTTTMSVLKIIIPFPVSKYTGGPKPLNYFGTYHMLVSGTIFLSYSAFCIKISDPRFGGTYLTLFSTVRTLAWILPNTKCSNTICSATDFPNICNTTEQSYNCVTIVDGYYVEAAISMNK
ncbi:acetyl-coenzyme A transporter 1-like, partial [Aphis craccivora]